MHKTFALAAVVFTAAFLPAQSPKPTPETNYRQFEKKISRDKEILHALNRLTFGPRPGDITAVEKMGLSKWIDLQLHPERIPESDVLAELVEPLVEPTSPQLLRAPVAAGVVKSQVVMIQNGVVTFAPQLAPQALQQLLTQQQINVLRTGSDKEGLEILNSLPREKAVQVLAGMPAVRPRLLPFLDADLRKKVEAAVPTPVQAGDTLAQGKLYRAIQSEHQLEEVLVDFWYNHFNVDANKGTARFLVTSYERDAIRPHVLGKFRDLLEATANSAAMMFYLDNWQSTARGLNENYARELMELHTLGVDGGYSQKDIVEVARCFTGWGTNMPNAGRGGVVFFGPASNQANSFLYKDEIHDKSEKTVLGVTIPANGGKEDGEKVLDILAQHPSTARFISKELAQRFVADDPPPALIDRMAKTFRDTDGDIRAVLSTMFASKEFLSEGAYRSKLKTPLEMVVSAVRATGAQVDSASPLVREIATLGQPLYRKVEPTGYSNVGAGWISSASLVERMNFALRVAQNSIGEIQVDQEKFSSAPATAARQILFTDAEKQTLAAIGNTIGNAGSDTALTVGMILGSPDFQRR